MNASFNMYASLQSGTSIDNAITVGICESQPLVIAGLQSLLQNSRNLTLLDPAGSLEEARRRVVTSCPRVMLLDKAFGVTEVIEYLSSVRDQSPTAFVVWGSSMTEPEALRFLKAGARGVLRKTAEAGSVLACLETVASGATWLEDTLFQHSVRHQEKNRSNLTLREQQVLELVEQGLRNKEIAGELGIQPGTVKIHMKHIFEKTGVRGRYGLALSGLHQRRPTAVLV
jgi:two-component system, NarL family, nitrate/nitrite response regulator NarL